MPASEGTRLISPGIMNGGGGASGYQYVPDRAKDNIEEPMEISMYDNDLGLDTSPQATSSFCANGSSKSFVFGGYDGVLASLIIISAAVGGGMPGSAVLAIGFATIFASAISIGITEYRSSKAHQDFLQAEKRRELWEFKHCRDKEMSSMVTRLERRGMTRIDAQSVVSKMAQYENVFVNLMVIEDLGLQISDEDENMFFMDAFMMFFSYAVMGILPVLIFLLDNKNMSKDSSSSNMDTNTTSSLLVEVEIYGLAVMVALLFLGIFGMIKSSFSSSSSLYSVVEAILLGSFCAAISFGIGYGIRNI